MEALQGRKKIRGEEGAQNSGAKKRRKIDGRFEKEERKKNKKNIKGKRFWGLRKTRSIGK